MRRNKSRRPKRRKGKGRRIGQTTIQRGGTRL